MTPSAAFATCEATVRRADPDRYLATLFAPTQTRSLLYALYAFNHELARVGEMAGDSLAGEIRLQWWRQAVEGAQESHAPAHPVAIGLAEILSRDRAQQADLQALIDAREIESSPAPFSTLATMENHADATSACLMRMAARVIAGTDSPGEAVAEAGIAYGLTGMLRSFRFHALRGKVFLPADLLAAQSLSIADVVSGKKPTKLKRAFDEVATCALHHFRRARQIAVPQTVLSAVLPASLVPAYLFRFAKNVDPLRNGTDVLRLRKQLIMFRAALLHRL